MIVHCTRTRTCTCTYLQWYLVEQAMLSSCELFASNRHMVMWSLLSHKDTTTLATTKPHAPFLVRDNTITFAKRSQTLTMFSAARPYLYAGWLNKLLQNHRSWNWAIYSKAPDKIYHHKQYHSPITHHKTWSPWAEMQQAKVRLQLHLWGLLTKKGIPNSHNKAPHKASNWLYWHLISAVTSSQERGGHTDSESWRGVCVWGKPHIWTKVVQAVNICVLSGEVLQISQSSTHNSHCDNKSNGPRYAKLDAYQ